MDPTPSIEVSEKAKQLLRAALARDPGHGVIRIDVGVG